MPFGAEEKRGFPSDLSVPNLDHVVNQQSRETRHEIRALPTLTVHERIWQTVVNQVLLLLHTPWARLGTVHDDVALVWGRQHVTERDGAESEQEDGETEQGEQNHVLPLHHLL